MAKEAAQLRIALIKPPSNAHTSARLEPLGLCYIAAVCRDAGHEVAIWDLPPTRAIDIGQFFVELDRFRPDLAAFSAMTENFKNGLLLAGVVKARYGCKTVFGGWHVSGDPQAAAEPVIDYVVRGEGEETVLELLEHLEGRGLPLEEIQGITFKKGAGTHSTPTRSRNTKLNSLPVPMRDGLPVDRYRLPFIFSNSRSRMRTLSVQASRGCPYECIFCQTPTVWSNRWTARSAASVVDEIESLVNRYNINSLGFRDEEFTIRPKWVMEICEEMIRRGLHEKLCWGSFARVDDITPELARTMRRAGCTHFSCGIEVSNEQESGRLHKFYKREEAENAFRICREVGIATQANWIIGFPWDTLESLDQAFEWILTLPIDFFTVGYATPYAGTPLRKYVDENDLLLSRDTNLYTTDIPIIRTPHIPLDVLEGLCDHYRMRYYRTIPKLVQLAGQILKNPERLISAGEMALFRIRKSISLRKGNLEEKDELKGLVIPESYLKPAHPLPATGNSPAAQPLLSAGFAGS